MLTACSRACPDHAQIDHLFGHKTRKETEVELLLQSEMSDRSLLNPIKNENTLVYISSYDWTYAVIFISAVSVQQAHNGHNR